MAAYASYSQSFLPATGSGSDGKPFKPTEGEQYKIGLRYQPADRDLMVSAAMQSNVTRSIPGSDFDEQTGKERSTGLEIEAKRPTHCSIRASAMR